MLRKEGYKVICSSGGKIHKQIVEVNENFSVQDIFTLFSLSKISTLVIIKRNRS